ncbi:MAG TPA: cobalt-precorrin 5A hydrolase, partial [Verrucomicrobiae bacterium]|nr:cobalt-precorrin 5A hydrolase [Verrucomicrobiae bacterium]
MTIAVVAITRNGARLGASLPRQDAELFVLRRYAGEAEGSRPFDDLRELLAELWGSRRGIVCIMAAGIVVRLAAPLLRGKDSDPAVVVM